MCKPFIKTLLKYLTENWVNVHRVKFSKSINLLFIRTEITRFSRFFSYLVNAKNKDTIFFFFTQNANYPEVYIQRNAYDKATCQTANL